jgi:2-polyprenyl-3-methyl-5-hydroxy-6-metoxy-1,4-benzoquinol methylase
MNSFLKLDLISDNVEYIDGIWYSKGNSAISYPGDGNDLCFQIEEDSFWFNHRNSVINSLVNKFSPQGCIFDIGGGNGFVTKSIGNCGFETVLVEPGIQGIKNARARGIKNLLCSTLEGAQFRNACMPAIGIFDVLEHIEDDMGFIKKLSWYLVPDGLLFITVPAYEFLWSQEDSDAGHYRRYTLKKLIDLLVDSGFKIKYKSYFFALLPLPILLFRTLPYRFFHLKKSRKYSNEHSQKKGIVGDIFSFLLKVENRRISNLKAFPFGGSCIIVAQK